MQLRHPSLGVVVLHIDVRCMQDHCPGRDINITTCYLGNTTVEERYEQHYVAMETNYIFTSRPVQKLILDLVQTKFAVPWSPNVN